MMWILDWAIAFPELAALAAFAIGDIALLLVFVVWDGKNFERLKRSSGLEVGRN